MSESESGLAPFGSWDFYFNCVMAFGCVILASLAAGLTMGLVAIEPFRLQVILETKEEDCTSRKQTEELLAEKECARKILPLVTKHHLLLVTLLLMNSIANEALPLFLDEVVPTYVAIVLSVTLVLMFGEIIPSAIFTGPNQLFIASRFVPLVKFFILVIYPISYPISRVLDYVLGEDHDEKFNKAELRALVKLHAQSKTHVHRPRPAINSSPSLSSSVGAGLGHRQHSELLKTKLTELGIDERTAHMAALATAAAQEAIEEEEEDYLLHHGNDFARSPALTTNVISSVGGTPGTGRVQRATSGQTDGGLEFDEVLIMHGALDLKETRVSEKMIPLVHAYMLSTEDRLTEATLADLVASGHSRIPVYEGTRTNIRGLLLVKKLIVINPQDSRRVDTLYLRLPVFVSPETTLLELLNEFQKGSSHMCVVTDHPQRMLNAIKNEEVVPDDINVYGICTLENIMEALIKEDISDETDFQLSVKHTLFQEQRKRRLTDFALKLKTQRKLALTGTAALVGAKNRSAAANSSYGSIKASATPPRSFDSGGARSSDNHNKDGIRTPLLNL